MSIILQNTNTTTYERKLGVKMSKLTHKKILLASAALLVTANMTSAQEVLPCDTELCLDDGNAQTISLTVGENTELEADSTAVDASDLGISVAIDGEQVLGEAPTAEDAQRTEDIQLDKVDIQVKFDGLEVKPMLNVSTSDLRRSYLGGDAVEFLATTNYPAWISHAEILIYELGQQRKLAEKIQIATNGYAQWMMPIEGNDKFEYVLRVYDEQGRFDETIPLSLKRSAESFETHEYKPDETPVSPGNGEDRTAKRNIPIYGGAVTVYGRHVPPGYAVSALGENLPIDNNQAFVVQRILPPGDHSVDVEVSGVKDGGISFSRDVNIPANDWFYVGLADLTVSKRLKGSKITNAATGDYDDVYTKGRLAFYLKGKIKGKYILTAAADTNEERIQDLFTGLDAKNTRSLLRRIDPNKYYAVYGDDSTAVEDAPTSGKFYIRLERGDSHVMWGNFKSSIRGSEFLRSERALYGASAVYKSEETTSFGEPIVEASANAAQPGTLPQRDIMRGTGGSAYFLKRQDITSGSETISIEIRDPDSGRLIERRELTYNTDYRIDYIQGVIILKEPLTSTASDGSLVRDGALGHNIVNLVAQYEYTPTIGDVDGYSYGGRAQAWVGDKVRFGVTGLSEKTGNVVTEADQEMLGADVILRHSEGTWVKGEYARTKGPGFGHSTSVDGGLTIDNQTTSGSGNRSAEAFSVEAQLDLSDVSDTVSGRAGGYYQEKQAGFATLDYNIDVDQRVWGGYLELNPADRANLGLRYDHYDDANGKRSDEVEADMRFHIDQYLSMTIGAKYSDLTTPGGGVGTNGERIDVAARVDYVPDDDRLFYAFGQATVSRTGNREKNHRAGVGAKVSVTEKVDVKAEVSYGTSDWGAFGGINYRPTADEHYYIGYKLDPERSFASSGLSGTDFGGIVLGMNRKYNDLWSVYNENNVDLYGERRSLTSTYGVNYTPDARWSIDAGFEFGRIADPNAPDFDRKAVSIGISSKDEDLLQTRLRGELRFDDSDDDTRDMISYLFSGGFNYKADDDWRLVASIDALISESDQSSIRNGDYVEGSVGYAYRPIDNDRFNALFKYGFLFDLPGADQVTVNGSTMGPRQRSHVFSADGTWQVNNNLALGAKYGFRFGDIETARGSGIYNEQSAHLAVLRADFQVLHNWDLLLEGRKLWSSTSETSDFGALAAVYRHVGENAKVGVGYNFGEFSDDLTDLTYDDEGVFLNVIGKF